METKRGTFLLYIVSYTEQKQQQQQRNDTIPALATHHTGASSSNERKKYLLIYVHCTVTYVGENSLHCCLMAMRCSLDG